MKATTQPTTTESGSRIDKVNLQEYMMLGAGEVVKKGDIVRAANLLGTSFYTIVKTTKTQAVIKYNDVAEGRFNKNIKGAAEYQKRIGQTRHDSNNYTFFRKITAKDGIKVSNKNGETVVEVTEAPALQPGSYKEIVQDGKLIKVGETYSGRKVLNIFEGKVTLCVRYEMQGLTMSTTAWDFAKGIETESKYYIAPYDYKPGLKDSVAMYEKDDYRLEKSPWKKGGVFTKTKAVKGEFNGGEIGLFKTTDGVEYLIFADHSARLRATKTIQIMPAVLEKYKRITELINKGQEYTIRSRHNTEVTGTMLRYNGTKVVFQTETGEEEFELSYLANDNLRVLTRQSNNVTNQNSNKQSLKSNKMATVVKKDAKADKLGPITAYNVKTKEKGVAMKKAVIDISNGRYIAKGVSEGGDKLTSILSKDNAEKHIAAKNATKGEGW